MTVLDPRVPELVKTSSLSFDPDNPRFSQETGNEEFDPIEEMVVNQNVVELMGSIGEQGFFEGEPLLVARVPNGLIVVEGNRRLAALKILNGELDPKRKLASIEDVRREARYRPTSIPCLIFDRREDILRYLGYRHITGPKRWDSLAKARYIKQLQLAFHNNRTDDDALRAIAKEIGSRKDYVAAMLAGLTVYEAAASKNFFDLQHVSKSDVNFSVLTTALSYSNISEYIGLVSRGDIRAEGLRESNLRDLIAWCFSQDQQGETILGESRNLRRLSAIVSNPTALASLKSTGSLEQAYLQTEGPTAAFESYLNQAESLIKNAFDLYSSAIVSEAHVKKLQRISESSDDLSILITKEVRRKAREAEQ